MNPITVDPEKCNQDGFCVKACPTAVIELRSQNELPTPVKDFAEYCLACGHCVAVCPTGAFSLDWMTTGECLSISRELILSQNRPNSFYGHADLFAISEANRSSAKNWKNCWKWPAMRPRLKTTSPGTGRLLKTRLT